MQSNTQMLVHLRWKIGINKAGQSNQGNFFSFVIQIISTQIKLQNIWQNQYRI